jgi:hypothetical protein
MIENGYDSEKSRIVSCALSEFNLAQSTLVVDTFISRAKAEFMLKISQTQMAVAQRN